MSSKLAQSTKESPLRPAARNAALAAVWMSLPTKSVSINGRNPSAMARTASTPIRRCASANDSTTM